MPQNISALHNLLLININDTKPLVKSKCYLPFGFVPNFPGC